MKSERRHELQTNYLADHLGSAVETSKPYALYVIIGVVGLAILGIGYGIYSTVAARASAAAWGDYYFNIGSGDAEAFRQVAQDHPGSNAADWANMAWADYQLMQGFEQIYVNRKAAEETIGGAIEAYEGVLSSSYEPELKARAAIALGQASEALGKLGDAERYYKQVATGNQPGLASMAGSRLAWITSGEGKSFYEWFATVKPTPSAPPALPGDLSRPPTMPDISFPDPVNLPLPGVPESPPAAAEVPAADVPAADASLPSGTLELGTPEPPAAAAQSPTTQPAEPPAAEPPK